MDGRRHLMVESDSAKRSQSTTAYQPGGSRPLSCAPPSKSGRELPLCGRLENFDHFRLPASKEMVAKCHAVAAWQITTIFASTDSKPEPKSQFGTHVQNIGRSPGPRSRFGARSPDPKSKPETRTPGHGPRATSPRLKHNHSPQIRPQIPSLWLQAPGTKRPGYFTSMSSYSLVPRPIFSPCSIMERQLVSGCVMLR